MKKRQRSIKGAFFLALLFPILLLLAVIGWTIAFALLYVSSGDSLYSLLLYIGSPVLGLTFFLVLFFSVRQMRRLFIEDIYDVSKTNVTLLARGDSALLEYHDSSFTELDELNKALKHLRERWSLSTVFSRDADYDSLGVKYLSDQYPLVDISFLHSKLDNLVFLSSTFTVGLLSLYYDMGDEKMTHEERENLLRNAVSAFSFLKKPLFAYGPEGRSLVCYLPGLDSLSIVKEKVAAISEDCSVAKRRLGGMAFHGLRAALVCYPYSSVSDMFSDLSYAKRQPSPTTIFLPERKKALRKNALSERGDMIASLNQIIAPLHHLDAKNEEKDRKVIASVFAAIAATLGTNNNDIVKIEATTGRYYSYLSGEEIAMEGEFVDALKTAVDADNSFYFSSRPSCSYAIARDMDENGIASGFFYVMSNGSETIGLFRLAKSQGDLVLDNYVRESLLRLGEVLTDYLFLLEKEGAVRAYKAQSEHILGLSSYMTYRIDAETMNLTYFSPNLRAYFPSAEIGLPCYKALYGLDKMCAQCPLRTKAKGVNSVKMPGKVKEVDIVTSLTLNERHTHEYNLLVERVNEPVARNPYDPDWLCSSFFSLVQQMENNFLGHSRGYLVLLCLDNLGAFLDSAGSEGTCFSIRSLIRGIRDALGTYDVYAYNPSTIAVLLPRYGHIETLDACEAIYKITKQHYLENGVGEDSFRVTYLPLGYPHGFTSSADFLAHVEEFYRNGEHQTGRDFIYFRDQNIARSASREDYMLSIIDEVFANKTANCVSLQPMLTAKDKKIMGAEILLRVEDTLRKSIFRADELSRIAERHNRISLITESLLNFVADLYKEHGSSVFALNSFRRIAINVDAAFLLDTQLSEKVASLYKEYRLPKDFLAFEVPESLINDDFEAEGNGFAGSGALLVCDQYTGKHVSLTKLKRFGFREVKLPFNLVKGIEVDPLKLAEVADIVRNALDAGLKVSVVGVENSDQFMALRDLDPNMLMQGYHFYKPLSRSDLIAAIVSHKN